jgi:phospholipase/lecithinase/hemolysin
MPALIECWRRAFLAAPLLSWLLLTAACSDSEFAQPFVADRVVAFGDESSVILSDGRKYNVNDFTEGNLDCAKNPIWVQELAAVYGKPFPACAGTNTTALSVGRAQPGATVDGLRQQIDAHLAADRLGEKDLVTMFVGRHDILAEYANFAADGEATITARLSQIGKQLGAQVNRVALAGSPVLVVTLPDLGRTPFGAAEEAANPGRAGLLSRLTSAFNTSMRLEIINDGRMIGLVDAFDLLGAMVKFPGNYGIVNATTPACLSTAPLPDCSTQTLTQVDGASVNPAIYLWADPQLFGPTGHRYLAIVATSRARNNPF